MHCFWFCIEFLLAPLLLWNVIVQCWKSEPGTISLNLTWFYVVLGVNIYSQYIHSIPNTPAHMLTISQQFRFTNNWITNNGLKKPRFHKLRIQRNSESPNLGSTNYSCSARQRNTEWRTLLMTVLPTGPGLTNFSIMITTDWKHALGGCTLFQWLSCSSLSNGILCSGDLAAAHYWMAHAVVMT